MRGGRLSLRASVGLAPSGMGHLRLGKLMGILKGNLVKSESGGSDMGRIGRGIEESGGIFFFGQPFVDGKKDGKIAFHSRTPVICESGRPPAQAHVRPSLLYSAPH